MLRRRIREFPSEVCQGPKGNHLIDVPNFRSLQQADQVIDELSFIGGPGDVRQILRHELWLDDPVLISP